MSASGAGNSNRAELEGVTAEGGRLPKSALFLPPHCKDGAARCVPVQTLATQPKE